MGKFLTLKLALEFRREVGRFVTLHPSSEEWCFVMLAASIKELSTWGRKASEHPPLGVYMLVVH